LAFLAGLLRSSKKHVKCDVIRVAADIGAADVPVFPRADALRKSLSFALAALVIASAAQPGLADHVPWPDAAWKWERVIVPNAASPAAEQCVVLDANLFAAAAPGLRDVRLLQDGREVAYAIDESVDEHPGSDDDRSVYDTVATTKFTSTGILGTAVHGSSTTTDRTATVLIPRRVPVERLRLIVADTAHRADLLPRAMQVTVTARPQAADHLPREPEIVDLEAAPERLSLPVTLDARSLRLQQELSTEGDAAAFQHGADPSEPCFP
jgi:hypothetical protein